MARNARTDRRGKHLQTAEQGRARRADRMSNRITIRTSASSSSSDCVISSIQVLITLKTVPIGPAGVRTRLIFSTSHDEASRLPLRYPDRNLGAAPSSRCHSLLVGKAAFPDSIVNQGRLLIFWCFYQDMHLPQKTSRFKVPLDSCLGANTELSKPRMPSGNQCVQA